MEKKKLVIVCAGGLAREIVWQLTEFGQCTNIYDILGFVDDEPELQNKVICGFPVLGGIEWLLNYKDEICAAICIGNAKKRKKLYNRLKENPDISFPSIIASNTIYSNSTKFGQGCIICVSNTLTVDITVGEFVVAGVGCNFGHDSVVGDFATLYPKVNLSGNVHIGTCAEIGTGANIIQGKNIGENSIVGAGSVVIKDIPPNCTVVGVPAVPIKFHSEV